MPIFDMIQQGVENAVKAAQAQGQQPQQGGAQPVQAPPQPNQQQPQPGGLLGGLGQTLGDMGHGIAQEGLGFFLDPVGAMDRQKAQRELAGKFQIIDPSYKGPKRPNMVTQEEFEKIAHTYSDIRLDRSDIKLDTKGMSEQDAAKFKSGAMDDIADIMQTGSGRQLINKLSNNTMGGEKDAAGNPVHHTTTLKGAADPDNPGTDLAPGTDPAHWSDKKGGNTVIEYAPGHPVAVPGATDKWQPGRSDVVLYHEMIHAIQGTSGTDPQGTLTAKTAVHPDDIGQNVDEYQAAGLGAYKGAALSENKYRAERKAIGAGTVGVVPGDKDMPQRNKYSPTIP